MVKKRGFILNGMKHFREVGTIFPCTSAVGREIAKNIDFDNTREIIELGAGEGAVTKQILKKMKNENKLICFEINKDFCIELNKINDKRIKIINDSVLNIDKYINKKQRYIISTLPIKLFNREEKDKIFFKIKNLLEKEGKFIQFQYSLLDKKLMRNYFSEIKVKFIPLNFLPGFVLVCEK